MSYEYQNVTMYENVDDYLWLRSQVDRRETEEKECIAQA